MGDRETPIFPRQKDQHPAAEPVQKGGKHGKKRIL